MRFIYIVLYVLIFAQIGLSQTVKFEKIPGQPDKLLRKIIFTNQQEDTVAYQLGVDELDQVVQELNRTKTGIFIKQFEVQNDLDTIRANFQEIDTLFRPFATRFDLFYADTVRSQNTFFVDSTGRYQASYFISNGNLPIIRIEQGPYIDQRIVAKVFSRRLVNNKRLDFIEMDARRVDGINRVILFEKSEETPNRVIFKSLKEHGRYTLSIRKK